MEGLFPVVHFRKRSSGPFGLSQRMRVKTGGPFSEIFFSELQQMPSWRKEALPSRASILPQLREVSRASLQSPQELGDQDSLCTVWPDTGSPSHPALHSPRGLLSLPYPSSSGGMDFLQVCQVACGFRSCDHA